MSLPTARTLAFLRKHGWTIGVVEKWIPQTRQRKDFLGCIDIIAIKGSVILGIQATSTSNMSARVSKSLAEPRLGVWLGAMARFEVWGWAKRGARGKRKLWTLRRHAIRIVEGEGTFRIGGEVENDVSIFDPEACSEVITEEDDG